MEYPESTPQAVALLKQALPRMMQHHLAPNPINYALWYHHVDQRNPALSDELERLLATQGTYSAQQGWSMFQRHVLAVDQSAQQRALAELHALAAQLLTRLGESINQSNHFDDELARAAGELTAASSATDLQQIALLLGRSVETLTQANRQFHQQMQGTQRQMEQLRAELDQARDAADRDPLTRLLNRQAFEREFQRLREGTKAPLTLLFCDIDHFKRFNDDYGHLMGDRVLQRAATLLQDGLPSDSIAARFGGEEFALLLPGSDLPQAVAVAEQIRRRLLQLRVKVKNSERVLDNISASFGVAELAQSDSLESLIERADRALYAAKRGGRNRVLSERDVPAEGAVAALTG
jgi:diguanylate cyclase